MEEININTLGTLLWPTDVVHEINKDSPLYTLAARDLLKNKFEIVISLSGISLVTGQVSNSKTSYLSNEILWGHRFKNCIDFDEQNKTYKINKLCVFSVVPCNSPLCNAKMLTEIRTKLVSGNSWRQQH